MAQINVDGGRLIVEITGMNRVWALKKRLDIPLAHVRGATADPGIAMEPKGIRAPGTHFPRFITSGTFYKDGERVFWDVRDSSKAVVVELAGERYTRLVVQVDDPRATVALIERAQHVS
ncbi:hypothetical protein GCM10010232_33090 [Streptomyces amakusaensis]|uniref:Uncharacterized protein n=1 Tax=Streptomyces amakusaensis TaxID=67271 RepID=A0ABW0AH22_9ACTN